jgi:hypothetical protein
MANRDPYAAAKYALEEWASWVLMSDYPSVSISDPMRAISIPGTDMRDSMAEKAAVRYYNGTIRLVHEAVSHFTKQHQRFAVAYYLAPPKVDPRRYTMDEMRIGKSKFCELQSDVLMMISLLLEMRPEEMACAG